MKKALVIVLFIFVNLVLFAEEPVGFLQYLDGEFVHLKDGTGIACELGSPVFADSKISLAEGQSEGAVRIITRSGIRSFSRFPLDNFKSSGFPEIDPRFQLHLLSMCAGSKVGGTKGAEDLFDWSMEINSLRYSDIEDNDFYLLLSSKTDSETMDQYNPLIYRLKKNLQIGEINFIIYSGSRNKVFLEQFTGNMEHTGDGWVFSFDNFPYLSLETYTVMCDICLTDGSVIPWEFTYRVIGPEDMEAIDQDVLRGIPENATDFEKRTAFLEMYWDIGLYQAAFEIERENGVH